jgi:hypothetical protein
MVMTVGLTEVTPCLRALRRRDLLVGAAGNMQALNEDVVRPYVDFVGSSEADARIESLDELAELLV